MKFINKRHTARVVTGNNEGTLDLEIIRPDSGIELKNGDGSIIPILDEQISEEPIEIKHEDQSTESNRLVNSCMIENNKFKKVALHGAKLGEIVTVKVKYLVE